MSRGLFISIIFTIVLLVFLAAISFVDFTQSDFSTTSLAKMESNIDSDNMTNETATLPAQNEPIPSPTPKPDSRMANQIASASAKMTKNEYWVAGYVTSEDNEPLVDSKIIIHDLEYMSGLKDLTGEEQSLSVLKTDEKGYYNFHFEKPSNYQIVSLPEENYLRLIEQVTLSEDKNSIVKNFSHPAAPFEVHGRVLDKETDAPIEGAHVILIEQKQTHPKQTYEESFTDSEGRFVIKRLAEGKFRLEASADGYVKLNPYGSHSEPHPLRNIAVNEQAQDKEYLVHLTPGRAAQVKVVDANQQPIPDSRATFWRQTEHFSYIGTGPKTDAQGITYFDKLPNEPFSVKVEKEPYALTMSGYFEPGTPQNPTEITVTLALGATVSGKVATQEGEPAPNQFIVCKFSDVGHSNDWADVKAKTNEQGEYTLKGLPFGEQAIVLSQYESQVQPKQTQMVNLQEGEEKTGVDFVIDLPKEKIHGKVINDEEEPVEGVFVHAVVYLKNGEIAGSPHERTDENGEFVINNAPEGDEVQFQLQGDGYAHTIIRHPMDGKYKVLTMNRPGTLSGKVVDSKDQPIQGAVVYPIRLYGGGTTHRDTRSSVTTGPDGTFEITDLNPMEYRLSASAEGYCNAESDSFLLKAGKSVDNIVIRMEEGMSVQGVVVNAAGQPVSNAQISIRSNITGVSPNSWSSHFDAPNYPSDAMTDAQGRFTVQNYPLQDDALLVQHEEYAPTLYPVPQASLSQQPFTIRVTEGGAIVGKVIGHGQQPLANYPIHTQNFPQNLYREKAFTDQNGEYRIEHLAPMPYMVLKPENEGKNIKEEYKTVEAQEGQEVRADFGAGEETRVYGTVYVKGEPASGVQVDLDENNQGGTIGTYLSTLSGQQGQYAFGAVPPGSYSIYAAKRPSRRLTISNSDFMDHLSISDEQEELQYDIYLSAYEIQGIVKNANSGEPLSGIYIKSVRNREIETTMKQRFPMETNTTDDGTFVVNPLDAGKYHFFAFGEGYETKEFDVQVQPAAQGQAVSQTQVEVQMVPDSTTVYLQLMVDGEPARTSWIHAYLNNDGLRFRLETRQESEPGLYHVQGLEPGNVTLDITSYANNQMIHAFTDQYTVQKGVEQTIPINMYRIDHYEVKLVTPGDREIEGDVLFEILGLPEEVKKPLKVNVESSHPLAKVIPKNTTYFQAPKGPYKVRLTAPGYQPVEFIPESMVDPKNEDMQKKFTIPIKPL